MRHLSLTKEREARLIEYLDKRCPELDADNRERIKVDKQSDEDYENDKAERARAGGVFAESNMPVPLTCYVVDHFASRTEEEIYGRSPMVRADPEGPADQDTARGLDRFMQYKVFKRGNARNDLLESNHTAFRHRAQFLKAIYFEDVDEWEEHAVSVLHSGKDNSPVLILNHGYVIEGVDKFIDAIDPLTQQPIQVLEADPTVALNPTKPEEYFFAPLPEPIRFRDVAYAGPKSREVDSDCIRIPSDARSLEDADIIVELYDKPMHWAEGRFLEREWLKWEEYEGKIKNGETAQRKTDDTRKKISKENKAFDRESATIGIHEIWLERDVLEWGRPQRIVVWYDKKRKILIDYEYQKKVTPSGRHPFTAIAVAKTKQFWWGKSIPEILKPFQEYCDLQWNRHSFRNSINSNPIIAQNPEAIQEKKSFLEMKPFDVVTLEHGKTIQDWLQAFVFPNADHDTQDLIDKAIYWVNFWLGISNIARGDYSDVPQNTTLGGQEASLKEASKLSRRWSRRIVAGIEDHVTKLFQIALATMDEEEVYTYLEGEQNQTGFITKDSVRDFLVNAKLIVAKDSSTQALQEQQMTLATIREYMSYPPQFQVIVRPVMKQILFLLGHDDVETLLPIPMVPMMDPMTGQTVMVPATANMPMPPQAAPNDTTQIPAETAAKEGKPEGGAVVPFTQPQVANAR